MHIAIQTSCFEISSKKVFQENTSFFFKKLRNIFKTTTSLQNVILTAYNEYWKAAERNRQEWQKFLRPK